MNLRNKIIAASWVMGIFTVGLFITGLWACKTPDNNEPQIDAVEQPRVYQLADACMLVDDGTLTALGADIPFMPISDDDRYVVECMVAGEAGGHSYELMKAVAQCIAISMDLRQMSADEVRQEHQYHGYNPGLEQTDPSAWTMVCSAVSEIFDDGNFVVYEPIEYFYNPSYGGGDFHEKMDFIIEIEGVRFFRDVEVG